MPTGAATVSLFANQGHGSTAVQAAMKSDARVIGVCSVPPQALTLRNCAGRFLSPYSDPFAGFIHPWRLTRAPRFSDAVWTVPNPDVWLGAPGEAAPGRAGSTGRAGMPRG
jgi:hypothetical protein